MTKHSLLSFALLTSLTIVGACSGTAVVVNQTAATNAEKGTADKVKSYASTTPPAGATSMGMMSSPKVGTTTIPVSNVEVYLFTANIDGNSGDETLYWATDGQAAFVWGTIGLDCVDDSGASTGETGSADFVYEADAGGWGWYTSTGACGYSTVFGCSNDGGGEVCGGCDWNDDFIACVAAN